jgi:hypothetical protein
MITLVDNIPMLEDVHNFLTENAKYIDEQTTGKSVMVNAVAPGLLADLVANGLHNSAGLQRVVEEEVVVRRILVRDGLQ